MEEAIKLPSTTNGGIMHNLSFIIIALVLSSCATQQYVSTNFVLDKKQSCTVGSPIIEVERGDVMPSSERRVSSYLQRLVYGGIDGMKIRVLYREFANDMARPVFNEEFKYDITDTKTISYQDYRIEVVSATSDKIDYIVKDMPDYIKAYNSQQTQKRSQSIKKQGSDVEKAIKRQEYEDAHR